MPRHGINKVLGTQLKDSEGNVLMRFPYGDMPSFLLKEWRLADKDKLDTDNIKKVIFNPPATIVIFKDGTKTVVKTHKEDFDPEKGLLMALSKHIWSSRADFNRFMDKWKKESDLTE